MSEEEVTEQGVIRREEMPFLSQHGTAYALYDEEKETYVCALKSDHYQFREYVGLRAERGGYGDAGGRRRRSTPDARHQGRTNLEPAMRATHMPRGGSGDLA